MALWRLYLLGLLAVLLLVPAGRTQTPRVVRLTHDGGYKQHLQWSPDGKRLLMTRIHAGLMGLWTMNADGSDLKRLIPELNTPHFDGHWSPDSRRVVYVLDILQGTDGKLQINTVQADGNENRTLIPHKAFEESPRWAPDGKRILWVSTRDGNPELYTIGLDGQNQVRLTSEAAFDNNPSWSPDGKSLAFTSSRAGNFEIYTMPLAGGTPRRITQHPAMDYWPTWSPDGRWLAFTSNRDNNYEIYLAKIDGSEVRNLTRHPASDNFATWSPDSQRVAFVSTRDGGHDIYVQELK